MLPPDERLFEADLLSAAFRNGVVKGLWRLAGVDVRPEGTAWPRAFFWLAAARARLFEATESQHSLGLGGTLK